jgi:ectoine hydroxylase-related dioxygenase (phytanoyl-CoA dioxygenase family)
MLERFSIHDDIAGFYRENGYVVLTDLHSTGEVVRAREEVFALFARRFADINEEGLSEERLLEHFYDSERDRWRECARRMWDLLGVYSLAAGPAVTSVLHTLGLGEPIISTRPEVRTDMPGDEQYMQPWHQDWRYGQGSANAVTIWTPLRDVGVENGTIDVMPRTHLLGYLETEERSNPRRFSIVDPLIDDIPYEPAEMRLGEAIVFSQLLVHRSGMNTSGRARVTIQTRFSDAAEPEFVRNGFPTPQSSALVWDAPPSREVAEAVFAAAGGGR